MVTNMNYFLALVKKVLGIMLLHKLSIVAQTGYKACFFFSFGMECLKVTMYVFQEVVHIMIFSRFYQFLI